MRDVEVAVRVKLAARLRLERAGPQGECRRHYVLAAGAGELVDDDEGDEEVRLARRGVEAHAAHRLALVRTAVEQRGKL
eukprot:scaffold7387_cov32-Phaeocystis_antarctica.AAC.1